MPSSVASVLLLANLSLRQVCACKLAIVVLVLDRSRAPRGRMRALRMRVKSRGRVLRTKGEFLLFLLSFSWWYSMSQLLSRGYEYICWSSIPGPSPITFSEAWSYTFSASTLSTELCSALEASVQYHAGSFCLGLVYFGLQMEWGMSSLRYPYTLELFLADLCFSLVRFVYGRGEKMLCIFDLSVFTILACWTSICHSNGPMSETAWCRTDYSEMSRISTQWRVSIEQGPS
jgi:hypothetical protein